MRWVLSATVLLFAGALLGGCAILDGETCGPEFVAEDGRCVLRAAPDPYLQGDLGLIRRDAAVFAAPDAGPSDAEIIRPDAAGDDPWRDFRAVLVVDRSTRSAARSEPDRPGLDLDAVGLDRQGGSFFADAVYEAVINDPFGVSQWSEAGAALGPRDGTFVSLGTEGAYVLLGFEGAASLRRGDQIRVLRPAGAALREPYEVFACMDAHVDLTRCARLGQGEREAAFPLE